MRTGKRAAALALGAALTLSMTACGNGTANKEDATEKIRAATEKVNAAESMEATMVMEMDMSAMGQSVQTDTTMDMVCFNDPMKMKADMTMDMGALGSVSMSIFAQAAVQLGDIHHAAQAGLQIGGGAAGLEHLFHGVAPDHAGILVGGHAVDLLGAHADVLRAADFSGARRRDHRTRGRDQYRD